MQISLSPEFKNTPDGEVAEAIVRKCVHCGFCTATCPTYQLLGDELDGPRGRIYLMKQALEGEPVTRKTQIHLDRCLTCRSCETTCPSGVEYGQLLAIGRRVVDERVVRPVGERAQRWLLKEGLTSPLFAPAVKLGQALRPLLPGHFRGNVPKRSGRRARHWPVTSHARKVLLLPGCVQPSMMPNINSATARVLDAAGIQTLVAEDARCCGAIRTHLSDIEGGLADMRRNVDAWWPMVSSGQVEAIVMNASGCGAMVKDYVHALAQDAAYADKARFISGLTKDLSELLPDLVRQLKASCRLTPHPHARKLVFHSPCTLQHGQKLGQSVVTQLREMGFVVNPPPAEGHLCCGSAGTYSVLQPNLSRQLRDRKLKHLEEREPNLIVSANIGCIQHLQAGTQIPVRHWVEVVDEALVAIHQ